MIDLLYNHIVVDLASCDCNVDKIASGDRNIVKLLSVWLPGRFTTTDAAVKTLIFRQYNC